MVKFDWQEKRVQGEGEIAQSHVHQPNPHLPVFHCVHLNTFNILSELHMAIFKNKFWFNDTVVC